MESVPFKQVDVFTRRPFFGNPVAVVFEAERLSSAQMQRIAAWTNLSETTFVLPSSAAGADYRLRIFTPKQELPFAGHPTIGSAHAVLEMGFARPRNGRLTQECRAGHIELEIQTDTDGEKIFLRTPAAAVAPLDQGQTSRCAASLGVARDLLALRIDVGVTWLIADVDDSETIAAINPRLEDVQALSAEMNAAGITVFGRVRDEAARLSVRSFAPILGVAEDPVCGSGNAAVAAYLAHSGRIQEIGAEYIALQGMALGRAGEVAVRVTERGILIGGCSVTCIDSRLRLI